MRAIFAAIIALIFVAAINDARAQFTFASDSAQNYGGAGEPGWTNGSDAGTGFSGWGFTDGSASTGSFIGNPTNNGIANTNMGTEAFGMFANSSTGGYANRSRGFDVGLTIGDSFTFDWGMNWDSGNAGGAKGFDLRADSTTIFNVNSGSTAALTTTGSGTADSNFGTNNMRVTMTRTSTGYTFTMVRRSDGTTFSTNISSSATVNNLNFYIGNQQDNSGNRNIYFDNLSITNSGVFSSGGTVTNANTFSGSGALSIGNSTTLILSGGGDNNYTGATTISNGSTLIFAGAGTSTFASTIGGGTGNVIMSNSGGLVVLNNNNTYSGNTTVTAGRLRIGNASGLGTTGTLTVGTGGQLQLSNGITMSRGITLSGDGLNFTGSLLNVNGSNIWSGNITNASNTRINADAGTTLTISGNIVNSGGSQNFYIGGAGNVVISGTLDGTATTGNGALYKDGSGVLTLSNNNTGLSGLVRILDGTVRVGSAGNLGGGTVEIGGTGTLSTTSNLTRTAGLTVTDASGGAVVDVASGTAFTQTGVFTGAPTATTKIGKAGAGDLIFNAASGSTFGGQIQIGEGRVIVGTTGALGTNVSTGNRGIDLGLNVGDTSTANNVALLASNGVTVGQSIYVAANSSSAVRTIGLSGNGTNTFSNEIFLAGTNTAGNLTLDTGSSASNLVNLTGAMAGTGGVGNGSVITIGGSGTVALSSTGGTTDGRWVVNSGATLAIGNLRNLGELAGGYYANKVTLNGGTLRLTNSTSLTNVGIQVAAASSISVDSGLTATNPAVMGGTADITKSGAGSLVLTAANTNAGNWTVTEGVLSVSAANNLSTNPASSVTNRLTLNGGTLAVTAGFTANANAGITVGASGGTIDVATSHRLIQGGGLSGSGALTKTGLGTLSLTNTSASGSYAGTITVTNGTLQANSILRGANISVGNATTANNSVLMGAGQVGTVTINTNGRISPGNSVGILSVSNALTFNSGGSYLWEITNAASGAPGTNWDLITVDTTTVGAGTLNLPTSGQFTVNGLSTGIVNFSPTNNYTNNYFQIVSAANVTGGTSNIIFLADSGLGTGSWTFATNNSGLFLNYVAPGVSLLFTNTVAADQGSTNLMTNNPANAFATISDSGGVTAVTISNTAPLVFTNANNSYSGVTTIEQGTLVAGANSPAVGNGAFGSASTAIVVGSLSSASSATLLIGNAGVDVGRGILVNSGGTGTRTIGATNASGAATYSGSITMNTNVTLSSSNSAASTVFSGVLGGSGAVTVAGSGTVVLSGANTYTNTTTVSSNSTLVAANNTALGGGSGATTVNNGGTLAFSNNINEDEAITIAGTGAGGLGALRNLSGANTNTATVTLAADSTIASDSGSSLTLSNIDVSGVNNRSVTLTGAGNTTLRGSVSTFAGSLTNNIIKDGSGTLTVNNNGTSGTGQLNIIGGTVTIANGSISTSTNTGTRAIDLGISTTNATTSNVALYASSGVTVSNSIYVAPNSNSATRTIGTESGSGTVTYNNQIYLGGNGLLSSAGTANVIFSGNITNDGTHSLTKVGAGTVTLSAANTYAGSAIVEAGTLALTNGSALADGVAVTVNGGTLAVNSAETVGSLSGSGGSVALNAGLVSSNNSATSFAGTFTGSGSFSKNGTGTQTLSGNSTLYSGEVILNNGTLLAGASGAFGTGTVTVNFDTGGGSRALAAADTGSYTLNNNFNQFFDAFSIGSAGTGSLTLGGAGKTYFLGNDVTRTRTNTVLGTQTIASAITGSNNFAKEGAGTLIFSGGEANTFVGNASVNNGVLVLQKTAGVNALTGAPTISSGATLRLGASDQLAGDSTALTVNTGGTFDLNNFNESLALSGSGSVTLGTGALTLNILSGSNNTFSGVISGGGSVVKTNAGTQILSGNNTYTGGTLVAQGTLRIGAGGTTGSVTGDITNNATVTFNRSDNITYGNVISGLGAFQKWGAGTLTLSGANTMGGANHFLIDGTTLFTAAQGAGFTGTLNLGDTSGGNSATLSIGTGGVTISNPIVVRSGSTGTMTISALNTTGTATFSGATTLSNSVTLSANAGGNLSLGAVTMGNNSITYSGANNVTIAGAMSATTGAAELRVNGSGVLTLSGNNSASNQMKIILNSGTLSAGALSAFGTTPGSIYGDKINFNGGTLQITDDVTIAAGTMGMTSSGNGGTINVASGKTFTQNAAFTSGNASGSFNKTGSGTLVLGDAGNQINPIFNIREGTVSVASTGALGAGGTNVTLGDTSTAGTLLFTGSSGSTGRTYTVNAGGGTINVSNATTELTLTTNAVFTGTFTKAGQGTLILGNTSSGTGRVSIDAGTLSVAAAGNLGGATGSNAVTLNGGTLRTTANMNLGNRGVTVASTGGTISVQANTLLTQTNGLFGTGNLTKAGSGSLSLTNTSGDYAGALTVTNGTLQVNTTLRGANISVGHESTAAGAILMGAGSVGAVTIDNNGRISPGNSVGILSVASTLNFNSGGSYLWEISGTNGPAGTDWDLISVDTESTGGGTLNINGAFTIAGTNFSPGSFTFNTQTNYPAFQIVRATTLGTDTASLANLSFSSLGSSLGASGNWAFSFTNGSGLYATYSAPTASLVFTNGIAANQGDANLVTNNNAGDLATITNQGGVTAVVISNTAPVTFTNGANSYSGATTIEAGTLATTVNAGNASGAFGSNSAAINLGSLTVSSNATILIGAAGVDVSKAIDVRAGGTGVRTIGATNASGVATYSGGIALATNATLSASNSGATTLFSGAISGTTGNLTASGSGVVVLSGANTFSGTTTVSSNTTLVAANNAALGNTTGNTTVNDGGTLALSNNISSAENIAIAGTNVGALRNLAGANTNSGTVTLLADGSISVDAGSSLSLANISLTNANTRSVTLTGAGNSTITGSVSSFTGSLTNNFIKDGSGTLTINNSGTSGTAQLNIIGGAVTIANGSISTSTNTGTRAIDLGISSITATTNNVALYANNGVTVSNSIYVAPAGAGALGTRTIGTESGSGTATFNNEIFLGGDLIVSAAAGGTALFSGNITNIGNLTKSGNGTVILAAPNTFTGTVNVAAGTLALTNGGALNDANSVVISDVAGANLSVNTAETIAGLSGGGATGGTVTLNAQLSSVFDSATNTFAGVIGGSGALVKGGTGVMVLSGANTFSGGLTQQTGTLIVGNNSAFGSGVYQVDFANNTNKTIAASGTSAFTLSQSNNIYNDLTIGQTTGNTGKLTFAGGTFLGDLGSSRNLTVNGTHEFSGAISGALGMIKSGSGTLILSGANTFGGGIFIDQGVIDLAGGSLAAGTIAIGGGSAGSAVNASNAVLRVSTNGTFSRTITLNGDTNSSGLAGDRTIQFANSGGTATLSGNAAVEKDFAVNVTDSGATGAMSGNISGSGSLTKSGNGVLTLSGSNSFGGVVVVNAGTLNLSGGSALNDTNAVTVNSGGTLGINNLEEVGSLTGAGNVSLNALLIAGGNGSSTQFSGVMSGAQGFVKKGAGTMTLSGANSYSGGTFIVGGTALFATNQAAGFSGAISLGETFGGDAAVLALTNGVSLTNDLVVRSGSTGVKTIQSLGSATTNTLSGAATLSNGVTVASSSGSTLVLAGQIGGTGLLTKTNDGAVALTASNTFTGGVRLNSGTILIGDDNALGTGTLQVRFDEPGTKTVASAGAGNFTVANTFEVYNNVTLGQTSGGTGSLTFSGTVALGDPAGTNNRNITVNGNHAFSGVVSGSNSLTKLGLGTLTLSGASGNTFTGGTVVSAGTLELNKTAGINAINGPITVSSGAQLLLSSSSNVSDTSAVTLSGGTITRASGVSEAFGNLNVTSASILDFGTGAVASGYGMRFENYTSSALLTINNFLPGSKLQFASGFNAALLPTGGDLSNGNFAFSTGFTTGTEGGYFTITAIPEPSTYLAAAGLLAMFLWPVRRRLIKDAKSILGLRAPARDRFGA